ncbi:histone-lysine N-methyltransferase, H3 lysine-9 specific SUVH1-like [Triticum dicoccoides]|uniref:histone-lysine N-methyltransferase, H3 lysine-9 specific SUVH1-like n=1 Tax=Triticum dicoccoides TaxID=85692 RepID=UPI00188FD30B|nr:histone-lysine N-methyltransferase, H3 lysine-9 specific SUVH1-like [Triticum dicoccoides]XP_044345122.1 histone-lysine N-methyltransferase, H3 lysine-9 specific SUVH1-like [Triticum aestivum]
MAGNQQPTSVVLNDAAVIDAKPLRTLAPMFPAPLGMHTFTIKGSPAVLCVTPFGPYAGGTELGMPGGVLPTSALLSAPADPNPVQPYMVHMNGAANANGPADPNPVQPYMVHMNGAANANGTTTVTPVLQTPPAVSTQESGKKKRGRPRRVQDTTVPTAPPVHLVPSAPPEGNNIVLQTPPSAVTQESGKKKRGRPRHVPDVSVVPTPSVPIVDGEPIFHTPPASSVHESVTKKRGRPKLVQDSSDTLTPPVHSKESEPLMQAPSAVTLLEDGKRKRGRPKRVPDSSVTPSSHSEDVDSGDTSKRGRPRKIDTSLLHLPSLSSDDPRESADNVLVMFDALRRRLVQLDEAKQVAKQQHNLKAGSIMMNAELRVNKSKKIGEVPGVAVGDMFYFRIEMCLVGLNSQSMAGIDYMSAKFGNEEDPVAISVVSAGVYENTEDDLDVLVYTGHGMSGKDDQKLERGNLALERSLYRGNPIRVVRTVRDLTCSTGKIYIYDGLYKIREAWMEKGKSGFKVFKHKLLREPGQPDGIAVWKKTEKWRENPSSRDHVILNDISYGVESKPVCLVNEVDDEKGPSHFIYTTKLNYMNSLSSMKKMQGCRCISVCLPGHNNCSCTHQNAGDLPYSASGTLVSRMPMLYECNDSCTCVRDCRNRVVQIGIQIHFEVFKTGDRGWGLRSWDPIRAGAFICEYAEDDYIFETPPLEQNVRWKYAPELLGEPSPSDLKEPSKQLPIVISAKRTGNIARFMNHSCSPNVFWQPALYDHGDEGYPHIAFFALKHIPPVTELTYDYGQSQDNAVIYGCDVFLRC